MQNLLPPPLQDHTEIVKVLVSVCSLEAVDDYGITSLFVAAQYGHPRCLEILANAGEAVIHCCTD